MSALGLVLFQTVTLDSDVLNQTLPNSDNAAERVDKIISNAAFSLLDCVHTFHAPFTIFSKRCTCLTIRFFLTKPLQWDFFVFVLFLGWGWVGVGGGGGWSIF